MAGNMGYLFSKRFYRDDQLNEQAVLTAEQIQRSCGRVISARPFSDAREGANLSALCKPAAEGGVSQIRLKVLYPGLYAGMSVEHGVGDMGKETDPDFKTGFSFDYTTGLPYIPGSGVKGALRACFIDCAEDVRQALADILHENVLPEHVRTLECRLFGHRIKGAGMEDADEAEASGEAIFFDAFPIRQPGTLMEEDYITPHKGLKNPQPIRTIKIKPGVTLAFYFSLPEEIDVEEKGQKLLLERRHLRILFEMLLVDWGVGAKTNTGYGNLVPAERNG